MKQIAIIGKPNVGKSSLFNRLAKQRIAITSDFRGTTRDINATQILISNHQVKIIDTGGIETTHDEIFTQVKEKSIHVAMSADLILYMVDGKEIPSQEDRRLLYTLSKHTPCFLVVNKIDSDAQKEQGYMFYEFGLKDVFFISIIHNRGISILLNAIAGVLFCEEESVSADLGEDLLQSLEEMLEQKAESKLSLAPDMRQNLDSVDSKKCRDFGKSAESTHLAESKSAESKPIDSRAFSQSLESKQSLESSATATITAISADTTHDKHTKDNSQDSQEYAPNTIRVGIVGRVNVGKSSLLNALVQKERSVVSSVAGTTIDPVDERIQVGDYELHFVDTAGIRRRGRIEGIEKYALDRTNKALEGADIAILVLDSSSGFYELDEKICTIIQKHNLGVIVVLNKWDIRCGEFEEIKKSFIHKFRFLEWAPFLTLSAKTKRHISDLKQKIIKVYGYYTYRIPTARLNLVIQNAQKLHAPPSDHGKIVKIYYATQYDIKPPQIALVSNRPKSLHFSYKRFLVNQLRKEFILSGVPIVLTPKDKAKSEGD